MRYIAKVAPRKLRTYQRSVMKMFARRAEAVLAAITHEPFELPLCSSRVIEFDQAHRRILEQPAIRGFFEFLAISQR